MSRLAKLELENFKSYKGKHVIGPFIDNFTSIVGPNGAGKSNLLDAISFVFGISSGNIRSAGVRELVYNRGESDKKKKTRVSVHLEKEDGTELVFERRVSSNNSGTEYKLNGKKVLYSEYSSALEDENILLKAQNFFVFQGDVESVALKSPQELTDLIEQISGSGVYKEEYKEKKEAYQQSIEGYNIFFTQKKNIAMEMRVLKEQRDQITKTSGLKEELNNLSIESFLYKLYHSEQKARGLLLKNEQKQNIILDKKMKIDDLNGRKRKIEREQDDLFKENLKKEREEMERERKIESYKKKLQLLSGRQDSVSERCKNHEKSLTETENEIERHLSIERGLSKELTELRMKEKQNAEGIRKISGLTKDQEVIYKRIKEKVKEKTVEYRQKIDEIRLKSAPSRKKEAQLEKEEKDYSTKINEVDREVKEMAKNLKTETNDLEEMIEERDNEEKILESLKQKREEYILKGKNSKERLIEVQDALSDYQKEEEMSIKERVMNETLSKLQKMFQGVYGRVCDIIKPTHKKYEVALGVLLGRNTNAIIVNQEKIAIKCIEYLKEQKIGQELFIPLDTIFAKPVDERLRTKKGIRPATDVTKAPDYATKAVAYICGDAAICDDIEIARNLCFKEIPGARAVSMDGSIINKSGFITGGSISEKNVFSRRGILKLQEERHLLTKEIGSINRILNEDSFDSEDKINRVRARVSKLQQSLEVAQQKYGDKVKEKEDLEKKIKSIVSKLKTVRSEGKEEKEKEETIIKDIRVVEKNEFSSFSKETGIGMEVFQGDLSPNVNEKRILNSNLISQLECSLSYGQERITDLNNMSKSLKEKLNEEIEVINRIQKEKETFEMECHELEVENEKKQGSRSKNTEKTELRKILEENKEEARQLSKELRMIGREMANIDILLDASMQEREELLKRCKIEGLVLPLTKGEWNSVALNQKLSLDYTALSEELKNQVDAGKISEYDETVSNLKEKIERLQANSRSTSKIDQAERRLSIMTDEVEYAKQKSKSIKEAYKEIKDKRKTLFDAAFKHIAAGIDVIYKDLTKTKLFPDGGSAYLIPEDQEEPYSSGIRFHAMPPMKRFRDIDQLSGGEKTVASLSLLFAIHGYRPAPFFILDEVDSALDPVNSGRFLRFVRERSEEKGIQFIVVSLKPGFYSQADSLVGIYRDPEEESSKSLTLKLRNLKV